MLIEDPNQRISLKKLLLEIENYNNTELLIEIE